MTFWQKLKYLVNNRMHAKMTYRKRGDDLLTESHVDDYEDYDGRVGVIEDKFEFDDFMYSDSYKIKLDALVTDRRALLKLQKLGSDIKMDWQEYIATKFTMIQRRIHDQNHGRLGRLRLGPYELRGSQSMFRRFKFKKNNFEEIRDRMIGDFYKGDGETNQAEMICSEFVANCTIAGLVELNDQLKRETGSEHDIIKMPIGAHEDLRYITPERFIKILKSKNCLEEIRISEHLHGISRDVP